MKTLHVSVSRFGRCALLGALTASLVLTLPGSARGETNVLLGDGGDTAALPIEIDGLYPTLFQSSVVRLVIADGRKPADMVVTFIDLVDLENGCLHPEEAMGDTSCGDAAGNGELSRQALMTLAVSDPIAADAACPTSDTVVASDRLLLLADREIGVAKDVGGGQAVCLKMTIGVPDLPENNLMMGDASRFTTRIDAAQSVNVEVLGLTIAAGTRRRPAAVPLVSPAVGGRRLVGGLLARSGIDPVRLPGAVLLLGLGLLIRERARRAFW